MSCQRDSWHFRGLLFIQQSDGVEVRSMEFRGEKSRIKAQSQTTRKGEIIRKPETFLSKSFFLC